MEGAVSQFADVFGDGEEVILTVVTIDFGCYEGGFRFMQSCIFIRFKPFFMANSLDIGLRRCVIIAIYS